MDVHDVAGVHNHAAAGVVRVGDTDGGKFKILVGWQYKRGHYGRNVDCPVWH